MPCYMKDLPDGRMFICGDLGDHCADCGWVGELATKIAKDILDTL